VDEELAMLTLIIIPLLALAFWLALTALSFAYMLAGADR
jgi:hypothetical protein